MQSDWGSNKGLFQWRNALKPIATCCPGGGDFLNQGSEGQRMCYAKGAADTGLEIGWHIGANHGQGRPRQDPVGALSQKPFDSR